MKEFNSGSTFFEIMIANSFIFWKRNLVIIDVLKSDPGSGVQGTQTASL